MDAVEVDFRCGQRGIEARRPVITRPGIGQASGGRHPIDIEVEPFDDDAVAADRDVPGELQRAGGYGLLIAAFGEPGDQRARILGLDPGRTAKVRARRSRGQAPAQAQLGHPWRAQLETLDVQPLAIGLQVGTRSRQRRPGQRDALGADVQRRWNRQLCPCE